MARRTRSQGYLFWVAIGLALVASIILAISEALEGEWGDIAFIVPILVLIGFSAFLYEERVVMLRAVRSSEARYRLLLEEASDPILVTDRDGRILSVNRRAAEMLGYDAGELAGRQSRDFLFPATAPDEANIEVQLERTGSARFEVDLTGKDGTMIPVEVSVSRVSDNLVQSIIRPIEERKAIEEALRHSEEVFRAVSELTSDYAYSMKVEPDGSVTPEWLTGAFHRVTGFSVEESRARGGWQSLVHPDDIAEMGKVLADNLESGRSVQSDFRIITKAGEVRHLRSWSRFERDEPDGPVVRIIGAVSDITAQKLLEQDLGESERRFTRLYERLPIGIYRRAWGGPGLDANPTCIEMFGYPDEETYLTVDPTELYADPRDRDRWTAAMEEYGVVPSFEVEYKRFDGSTFWGRNTSRLVREGNNAWIEGAIIDISEERALDEELRATLRDLRRADAERKRLLTHLVKAKEDERNRVASDIHDDSIQVMTSIAIDLERLARKAHEDSLTTALELLETRVRDAVSRLRTMVFELRPPTLDQEGLDSALRLYLEEFSIDTGIDYELWNALEEEPNNPTRVVLYRIAQEALTNVRKHSSATRVIVSLDRDAAGISMTISDDGSGFDPGAEDVASPGHIGLSEMRERSEMSGGRFEIASTIGEGTTVGVWVPELTG